METTRSLLGARIKELRKQIDLSQEQLAERIEIDPKSLSRIEVGHANPSLETLDKLAKVMALNLRDFFEFRHLDAMDSVKKEIASIIEAATENELRIFLKVLRALKR